MKHHIKDGDRLIATIETHGDAIVVVHEPQPTEEPKTNLLYPQGLEAVVKDGEIPKSIWCNYNGTKYEYRLVEPTEEPAQMDCGIDNLGPISMSPTGLRRHPAQRDYSHLINKWVKCSYFKYDGKWVKILSKANGILDNYQIAIDGSRIDHLHIKWLDLSNPLDYNPDEVERIIPFDIERWRKSEFVKVQTRDGREVEQLKEYDCIMTPFVGIIKGHSGVSCWHENGCYSNIGEEHSHDIMLVVKGEGGVR
jgi:hypothetical protein